LTTFLAEAPGQIDEVLGAEGAVLLVLEGDLAGDEVGAGVEIGHVVGLRVAQEDHRLAAVHEVERGGVGARETVAQAGAHGQGAVAAQGLGDAQRGVLHGVEPGLAGEAGEVADDGGLALGEINHVTAPAHAGVQQVARLVHDVEKAAPDAVGEVVVLRMHQGGAGRALEVEGEVLAEENGSAALGGEGRGRQLGALVERQSLGARGQEHAFGVFQLGLDLDLAGAERGEGQGAPAVVGWQHGRRLGQSQADPFESHLQGGITGGGEHLVKGDLGHVPRFDRQVDHAGFPRVQAQVGALVVGGVA
jgi:hypothetical protein